MTTKNTEEEFYSNWTKEELAAECSRLNAALQDIYAIIANANLDEESLKEEI
jgi:hypothetical protein